MHVGLSVRIALRALTANKLRTFLTLLGMVIGVGAVIALMSVGNGAQASVTSQIQAMGSNLLFVTPGAASEGGVRQAQGSAPTLTYEDAQAIAAQIADAVGVAPEVQAGAQVVAGGVNTFTRVMGVTPDYEEVRNHRAAEGAFITRQDLEAGATVAVLGSQVAKDLFQDANAIGQTVKINQVNFRVVGVMESKGGQGMGNMDDQIIVPLTTVQRKLQRGRTVQGGVNVNRISVQVASDDKKVLDSAVQQIGALLRERHRKVQDDFTITSQKDTLAAATQVTDTFTLLLGAIAGISLVVGGIGIMNIMLVSVTERTREIGIRKAVGAKRRDILMQFLVEATSVSIVGGILGIAIGAGLSRVIGSVGYNGSPLNTVVTPDAVVLAMGVSMAIGVFFGIYPAMRAASLRPIEALRYE